MNPEILFNFISPVTGRILCDTDKILVGDSNGIAMPSSFIPIGSLPDLEFAHIWVGNIDNRPIANLTIQTYNLPNLGNGKVWIGNGETPSRPVEGSPPQGPAGPRGPAGAEGEAANNLASSIAGGTASSLVKYGLEQLLSTATGGIAKSFLAVYAAGLAIDSVVSVADSVINAVSVSKDKPATYIDYRTINTAGSSLVGPRGADGFSGKSTLVMTSNLNVTGGRIEDIAPSPKADYDAVAAKWVWDLLNDNVEIVWA